MSSKTWILIGLSVKSLIGGYIPTFFGASFLSMRSLVGNTLRGIIGVYTSHQLVKNNF